jgi:hypothetical protein
MTTLGTTTANSTGVWSFTPSTALTQATHTITANATDAAGNVSSASSAITLTVDTTAPTAPAITTVSAATNNTRPTLTGTAEAGSTVTVYDGTITLGTATTNSSGAWSYAPSGTLSQSAHTLTVKAKDAAGNVSASSSAITLTVDTTAPTAPVITTKSASTSSTKPTIAGTAEANSTVTILDGSTTLGTITANSSGVWSYTPGSTLSQAVHTLTAKATDTAGNVSAASKSIALTVDTTAPDAPSLTSISASSSNTKPTIGGTAEANSTVTLLDGTVTLGTATANASGVWSYTPGSAFTQAAHTLTAKATDAAGNVSTASTGLTLTPGSTGLTTDATALSAAQTIRGSSASDTLKGGAGNDTLTGGAGSDALTGAAGNDTFVYTNATDSLVSGFDTISDFSATNMGTDVLKIGKTVTTANFKTASQAGTSSGLSADLSSALQALSFGQSCAALVTLTGAADAGSYVVINNHSTKAITTNGFLASSDTVIKVQTGATVTAASFIV